MYIYRLLDLWIDYIPRTYKKYSGIESDMYAYALAAASLNLPHQLQENFMSTCMKSLDPHIDPFQDNLFIHYCQSYTVCINKLYTITLPFSLNYYVKINRLFIVLCAKGIELHIQ